MHFSPPYPDKQPPKHIPLVREQFSDIRHFPHSLSQFEPYLPKSQAKGRKHSLQVIKLNTCFQNCVVNFKDIHML